jgi:hypothetical protein
MAKPFIEYAVVSKPFGTGYSVLGITSSHGRKTYGRWLRNDEPTNIRTASIVSRYALSADARKAMERIDQAAAAHRPAVEKARAELWRAEQERDKAIAEAAGDTRGA